eukprot:gnl/Dysnectes_brevis/1968_a2265_858.p1 GENE.gnl/Dysnectes_brevis/1968_a2265_858~~gnl/Dysnectes_brevis/1968_a2265_858.p1  ORF type:complete len:927 (-),score=301.69 gnl/Dysnectes_brevis/1968_a2265_858:952-3732(-)
MSDIQPAPDTKPTQTSVADKKKTVPPLKCDFCECNLKKEVRMQCLECKDWCLCMNCYIAGATVKGHKNTHKMYPRGDFKHIAWEDGWVIEDDLYMLEGIEQWGFGSWERIQEHVQTHSKDDIIQHFSTYFSNGCIMDPIHGYQNLPAVRQPLPSSHGPGLVASDAAEAVVGDEPMDVGPSARVPPSNWREQEATEEVKEVADTLTALTTALIGPDAVTRSDLGGRDTDMEPAAKKVAHAPVKAPPTSGKVPTSGNAPTSGKVGPKPSVPGKALPDATNSSARASGDESIATYWPLRGDFGVEFDNKAEYPLAFMHIIPEDSQETLALKLRVLQAYAARLVRREDVKRFVIEWELFKRQGILKDQMKQRRAVERFGQDAMDLHRLERGLRWVARLFNTPAEYSDFIGGIRREVELRRDIARLQRYRLNGITTMQEGHSFDQHRRRLREEKEQQQTIRRRRDRAPASSPAPPRSGRHTMCRPPEVESVRVWALPVASKEGEGVYAPIIGTLQQLIDPLGINLSLPSPSSPDFDDMLGPKVPVGAQYDSRPRLLPVPSQFKGESRTLRDMSPEAIKGCMSRVSHAELALAALTHRSPEELMRVRTDLLEAGGFITSSALYALDHRIGIAETLLLLAGSLRTSGTLVVERQQPRYPWPELSLPDIFEGVEEQDPDRLATDMRRTLLHHRYSLDDYKMVKKPIKLRIRGEVICSAEHLLIPRKGFELGSVEPKTLPKSLSSVPKDPVEFFQRMQRRVNLANRQHKRTSLPDEPQTDVVQHQPRPIMRQSPIGLLGGPPLGLKRRWHERETPTPGRGLWNQPNTTVDQPSPVPNTVIEQRTVPQQQTVVEQHHLPPEIEVQEDSEDLIEEVIVDPRSVDPRSLDPRSVPLETTVVTAPLETEPVIASVVVDEPMIDENEPDDLSSSMSRDEL